MSALDSIIFTLKNPEEPSKQAKELHLSEKGECLLEIPAHMLQRGIQTCETKTELIVYLSILRFSLGFNRNTCTASRRFLEKWTGIKNQNIGRGIEGLIQKGLIEKVSDSNLKHGFSYKVVDFSETAPANTFITRNHIESSQTDKCNQVESTQGAINMIAVRSQSDCEVQSKRLRSAITLSAKNKKEDLEESSSISEGLEAYLRGIQILHMRRIERSCVDKLLKTHSSEQIEKALKHVQARGTVGDGAACKLPLSYLTKSISRVLQIADEASCVEQAKVQLLSLAERRKELEAEKLIQSEKIELEAQEAFHNAFPEPEEREQAIAQIVQSKFKLLNPNGNIARKIATLHWFKNFHKKTSSERSCK